MLDTPVLCTVCARMRPIRAFLGDAGGELERRRCGKCCKALDRVSSVEAEPDLTAPTAPRTCWSCHAQPTPTRHAKLCRNCQRDRKLRKTEASRSRTYLARCDEARATARKWKPPAEFDVIRAAVYCDAACAALRAAMLNLGTPAMNGEVAALEAAARVQADRTLGLLAAMEDIGWIGK